MKKLLLLLLIAPMISFGQEIRVVRVIDEDTFVIEGGERVRMIGINALELKDIYGVESKNHLKTLIENTSDTHLGKKEIPPVSISDFVDHIDYIKNKIRVDHVGISSDFDGGGGIEGWSDASQSMNITKELVKRGYSQKEIEKI